MKRLISLLIISCLGCATRTDMVRYGDLRYHEGRLSVYEQVLEEETTVSDTVKQLHEDHQKLIKKMYPKIP